MFKRISQYWQWLAHHVYYRYRPLIRTACRSSAQYDRLVIYRLSGDPAGYFVWIRSPWIARQTVLTLPQIHQLVQELYQHHVVPLDRVVSKLQFKSRVYRPIHYPELRSTQSPDTLLVPASTTWTMDTDTHD